MYADVGFHFLKRARQSSVWVPRLVESSSCHSSTIDCLQFREGLPWFLDRIRRRDKTLRCRGNQGSGEFSSLTCFSGACGVTRSRFNCPGQFPILQPVRRGFWWYLPPMPLGELTIAPEVSVGLFLSERFSLSIHSMSGGAHTAYVFPVPVGAWTNPLFPSRYACQVFFWKGNGFQFRL